MNCRRLASAIALLFLGVVSVRAQNSDYKFEVGGQFSMLNRSQAAKDTVFNTDFSNALGFGGRAGYSVSPFWSLEAELNFFPDDDSGDIGGNMTQGLFGLKAGSRFQNTACLGNPARGLSASST